MVLLEVSPISNKKNKLRIGGKNFKERKSPRKEKKLHLQESECSPMNKIMYNLLVS